MNVCVNWTDVLYVCGRCQWTVLIKLVPHRYTGQHTADIPSAFSVCSPYQTVRSTSRLIFLISLVISDHYFSASTLNRWRTVVSGTWKYDDPRLNMSHEGAAWVWHVQPRVVIFPCHTNYRVSYVLSSDQLQESWIICKLKSFSPLYLHDLILNTDDLYSLCLKRYAILVIKNSFTEE